MIVKINKEGIISDKITTLAGEKYLTASDIGNIQGVSDMVDGRNTYTGNTDIIEVVNDLFIFTDNTDDVSLSSLNIAGDSQENGMFANSSITSFTCDLPKLITGDYMFYNTSIESYVSYAQNLKDATSMFEGCSNLTEVVTDLSTIKNGNSMFYNCSSLKLGKVDLSSVEDAVGMFYGCNLDGVTVTSILETIKPNEQKPRIDIGVTIDGLKAFYDKTFCISFNDFNYDYEGREYFIDVNENITSVEDLGYDYIEYDESGYMIQYPTNIWNDIEDTSGFFINNNTITKFSNDLPKVKKSCGMFNNVKTLLSFNSSVPVLEDASCMFQNSGLTSFNKALPKCSILNHAFTNTAVTSVTTDLSNVTEAQYAFSNCSQLSQIDLTSLNNLINGKGMFSYSPLITQFNYDLPNLVEGTLMFSESGITSFNNELPKLVNGDRMFYKTPIVAFDKVLPELVNGDRMFNSCEKLTSVTLSAPKLKYAEQMFYSCIGLKTLTINADELIDGYMLVDNCTALTTATLSAPKLKYADLMFYGCNNLTSFSGDLSSLQDGRGIFYMCKLDGPSVANIYNSIPQNPYPVSTKGTDGVGKLEIGIGSAYSSTASTNKNRLNNFAVAAGFTDWAALKQAFVDKGWEVTWYYSASDRVVEV